VVVSGTVMTFDTPHVRGGLFYLGFTTFKGMELNQEICQSNKYSISRYFS
jgi:hypothetical protein